MANSVSSCRLISRETEIAAGAENSQTLVYRIKTTGAMSQLDIYDQALTATPHPLPALYAAIEIGYVMRVRITAEHRHNWSIYLAYVTVGKPAGAVGGSIPTAGSLAPLSRPPVMWIERGSESQPVQQDAAGNAIVNSAGQPFDEPIFRDRPTNIFVVRRYFDSLVAIDRLNNWFDETVSADAALSRAAGELRYLGTETGEPVIEGSTAYWVGLSKVAARKGGWAVKILNRGWKVRKNGDLVNAEDDNGLPVTEPVMLTATGAKLPDGQTGTFSTYSIYTAKTYAPLFDPTPNALDPITNP